MNTDNIRKLVKCCISEKSLANDKYINAIQMDLDAEWAHPTAGNILYGEKGKAIAFVCDEIMKDVVTLEDQKRLMPAIAQRIKFVVEFRGESEVIYHPVEELRQKQQQVKQWVDTVIDQAKQSES